MSEHVALYRKWRPSVFSDVIGQDHITKVLRNEVAQHSVSHAYLFCGSRGTGKTTCAKILAKAANCENPERGDPCGKCAACKAFDGSYDILEMDAASHNGVNDIRDLCEKVNYMPIEMKKRVYIIDEVHMLSSGAFNALLKTLEEPPSHVIFILATTELNKIPATILSRCKRFDFHRISPEDMMPRLRQISDSENIGITDDALRLIAFLATGAMRDALSMLELFVGRTDVDREKAAESLGVIGNAPVLELLRAVSEKDTAKTLVVFEKIYKASKDMSVLCSELAEMFRNLLVIKYASNAVSKLLDADPDVVLTLRDCEDMYTKERLLYSLEVTEQTQNKLARSGLSRRTVAELMLFRLCDPKLSASPEALLERVSALEAKLAGAVSTPKTFSKEDENNITVQKETEQTKKSSVKEKASESGIQSQTESQTEPRKEAPKGEEAAQFTEMLAFGELLEELSSSDMITYSMLSDSYADIGTNGEMIVHVNPMGYVMLSKDTEKTEKIAAMASRLLGMNVNVKFVRETVLKKRSVKDELENF